MAHLCFPWRCTPATTTSRVNICRVWPTQRPTRCNAWYDCLSDSAEPPSPAPALFRVSQAKKLRRLGRRLDAIQTSRLHTVLAAIDICGKRFQLSTLRYSPPRNRIWPGMGISPKLAGYPYPYPRASNSVLHMAADIRPPSRCQRKTGNMPPPLAGPNEV
ncbi:hypothetical protein LX36DRAFT_665060 [Colletotrichum falcatum]|nr:hypothetical protein LX36DRAFT_665060 [Colletotrichum falcatum]